MLRKTVISDENAHAGVATDERAGNMRWGFIAMLLGAPLPIILLAFLFMNARGCQ